MSDSWERCEDCLEAIEKYGRENLEVCDMCTHLKNEEFECACEDLDKPFKIDNVKWRDLDK